MIGVLGRCYGVFGYILTMVVWFDNLLMTVVVLCARVLLGCSEFSWMMWLDVVRHKMSAYRRRQGSNVGCGIS